MARFPYPAIVSLIILVLCSSASAVRQTLSTGSSLLVEEHAQPLLVSPDATFSCGFYSVDVNAFSFSIWFTNAVDNTIVWTANRPDAPVNGHGSSISFSSDGTLVLADANGTTVWKSTSSGGKGSTAALLDTGNLVVRNSSGRVVWQSFDSPTDTLLPSQLLTKDKKLVSRYYNLYYDNDNVLRLIYDGPEITSIYWPDTDNNVFGNQRTSYNSSRTAILDDKGVLQSSDHFKVMASDLGLRIKRRITMDRDGNLRMYSLNSSGGWNVTWAALQQPCAAHGICGKNAICEYSPSLRCSCLPGHEMANRQDWSEGCKPMYSVICHGSRAPAERLKFVKLLHTDFYGFDAGYNKSVSFQHCRELCFNMCSCLAFSYRLQGTGVCYLKDVLFNGYCSPNFPGTIYLKVPRGFNTSASSVSTPAVDLNCKRDGSVSSNGSADTYGIHKESTKWSYFFVFVAVLGGLELLFIVTGWVFVSRNSMEEGYRMVTNQFRRFTYRELREATGNFKEELGRGGSGVVYRGFLDKGKKIVAVKKLTSVTQGEEEFWAEMAVIGRINHINLVRTWGFCSEGKHKLLVYEYVENESLDRHLFSTERSLPWSERYRTALGTARGLAYLHHECLEWVIHCDVKPENILLTRDFDAKIADFGLAKLSRRDGSGLRFSHMRGTTGYMAPEWTLNQPMDAKVDVYSYGVVLLEIVIGCRVSCQTTADGQQMELRQIVQVLRQVVATGDASAILDARLHGQFNPRQAMELVKISLACMEKSSSRPTMDDIVKALMACDDEGQNPTNL